MEYRHKPLALAMGFLTCGYLMLMWVRVVCTATARLEDRVFLTIEYTMYGNAAFILLAEKAAFLAIASASSIPSAS